MADAAITGLLCEGVTCPQSTGLGGGFVMTIFTAATGKVETLNAREMAPGKAFKDMFQNTTDLKGGIAVAVPGELKGYWELHQKYGKLEWPRLFRPVIELCRRGAEVSKYLANILNKSKATILNSPTLAEVFINPKTNDVYQQGDLVKRLKLAETLEVIAIHGAEAIYGPNGTIGQRIVEDVQKDGGILTTDDLMAYNVKWGAPAARTFENKKTLHSFTLPGSGALAVFMMNVLDNYLMDGPVLRSYQRIAETFKYAYARRSLLGDSDEGVAVTKNLTNVEYALDIRSKLLDNVTVNDHVYYGGIFGPTNVS